jgi:hypothetical protein
LCVLTSIPLQQQSCGISPIVIALSMIQVKGGTKLRRGRLPLAVWVAFGSAEDRTKMRETVFGFMRGDALFRPDMHC